LPPAERQKWNDLAKADKERFLREMKEFRESHPQMTKKPTPAFLLFANQRRSALIQEFPGTTSAQLSAMLSAEWKTMESDDKQVYVDQFEQAMHDYRTRRKRLRQHAEENEVELSRPMSPLGEEDASCDSPIPFFDPVPDSSIRQPNNENAAKSVLEKDTMQAESPSQQVPSEDWFKAADLEPLPLPPSWKSTRGGSTP